MVKDRVLPLIPAGCQFPCRQPTVLFHHPVGPLPIFIGMLLMKSRAIPFISLVAIILLQGCAALVVYDLYRTVSDINQTLTQVDSSIQRIQGVLKEGKELKRAADDGRLITTLAEKIPTLVQKEVERQTQKKIETLSLALKVSSIVFTTSAEKEDLPGAEKAYGEMTDTYNSFSDLMGELSGDLSQPLK
jgi:hypothetical protein